MSGLQYTEYLNNIIPHVLIHMPGRSLPSSFSRLVIAEGGRTCKTQKKIKEKALPVKEEMSQTPGKIPEWKRVLRKGREKGN